MELYVAQPVTVEALRLRLVNAAELQLDGALASPTAQRELNGILTSLHTRIVGQQISSFTVDVRTLNFVNSSAIRVFVDWIARAEAARYKLVFVTERGITWHRLSFSVLRSLAPATVEVIEKSSAGADGGRPS
jgi:hypothetical protein